MRSILRPKLVFAVINQGMLSIGSALIVILLARYNDQIAFGEIRFLIAVLAIFSFFSLPGISIIINHQVSDMTRADFFTLISTQLKWGILAFLLSVLFASYFLSAGNTELARAFVIGGILAPVANLYLTPGLALAGLHRFKTKIIVDVFIISCAVTGVTYGSLFLGSVDGIIGAYLGMQAIATSLCLIFVRTYLPLHCGQKNIQSFRGKEDGRQLTLLQIPFFFIPALEKVLIFIILGPIALAIFVIAVLPVEHFKGAFRSLIQFYMLPHLQSKAPYVALHWVAVGALLLSFGILALIVFTVYGMPLLFENFNQARNLSLLLVLAALPLPIHVIAVHWIAKRKIKTLWAYAGLAVITNTMMITLSALLFGLTGAVIAKIAYEFLLATGLLTLDRRT